MQKMQNIHTFRFRDKPLFVYGYAKDTIKEAGRTAKEAGAELVLNAAQNFEAIVKKETFKDMLSRLADGGFVLQKDETDRFFFEEKDATPISRENMKRDIAHVLALMNHPQNIITAKAWWGEWRPEYERKVADAAAARAEEEAARERVGLSTSVSVRELAMEITNLDSYTTTLTRLRELKKFLEKLPKTSKNPREELAILSALLSKIRGYANTNPNKKFFQDLWGEIEKVDDTPHGKLIQIQTILEEAEMRVHNAAVQQTIALFKARDFEKGLSLLNALPEYKYKKMVADSITDAGLDLDPKITFSEALSIHEDLKIKESPLKNALSLAYFNAIKKRFIDPYYTISKDNDNPGHFNLAEKVKPPANWPNVGNLKNFLNKDKENRTATLYVDKTNNLSPTPEEKIEIDQLQAKVESEWRKLAPEERTKLEQAGIKPFTSIVSDPFMLILIAVAVFSEKFRNSGLFWGALGLKAVESAGGFAAFGEMAGKIGEGYDWIKERTTDPFQQFLKERFAILNGYTNIHPDFFNDKTRGEMDEKDKIIFYYLWKGLNGSRYKVSDIKAMRGKTPEAKAAVGRLLGDMESMWEGDQIIKKAVTAVNGIKPEDVSNFFTRGPVRDVLDHKATTPAVAGIPQAEYDGMYFDDAVVATYPKAGMDPAAAAEAARREAEAKFPVASEITMLSGSVYSPPPPTDIKDMTKEIFQDKLNDIESLKKTARTDLDDTRKLKDNNDKEFRVEGIRDVENKFKDSAVSLEAFGFRLFSLIYLYEQAAKKPSQAELEGTLRTRVTEMRNEYNKMKAEYIALKTQYEDEKKKPRAKQEIALGETPYWSGNDDIPMTEADINAIAVDYKIGTDKAGVRYYLVKLSPAAAEDYVLRVHPTTSEEVALIRVSDRAAAEKDWPKFFRENTTFQDIEIEDNSGIYRINPDFDTGDLLNDSQYSTLKGKLKL